MKIKTYLINLEKSVERRERALAETAKYPFMDVELVKAVYGKEMSEEEVEKQFDMRRFICRYLRKPIPSEIGCTLSHRECYRRFLATEEEFALILEDDICFLDPSNVERIMSDLIQKKKRGQKVDLVTLSRQVSYFGKSQYDQAGYSFYRIYEAYGTCAYLINRRAARILLSTTRASIVADDFTYMFRRGIVVHGIYPTFAAGLSEMMEISSEVNSDSLVFSLKIDIPYIYKLGFRVKNRIVGEFISKGWMKVRKIDKGKNL